MLILHSNTLSLKRSTNFSSLLFQFLITHLIRETIMLYLKQNKFKSSVYRDMNRVKLYIEASNAEKVYSEY